MEWQEIIQYFKKETMLIAALLWCLGLFIKKAPFKHDWIIPFVLLGVGVIITPIYMIIVEQANGNIGAVVISGIIQGVFAATLAVFGNEAKKQITNKRKCDEREDYKK